MNKYINASPMRRESTFNVGSILRTGGALFFDDG